MLFTGTVTWFSFIVMAVKQCIDEQEDGSFWSEDKKQAERDG